MYLALLYCSFVFLLIQCSDIMGNNKKRNTEVSILGYVKEYADKLDTLSSPAESLNSLSMADFPAEKLVAFTRAELKAHCLHVYNALLLKWIQTRIKKEIFLCSNVIEQEQLNDTPDFSSNVKSLEILEDSYQKRLCYCRYLLDLHQKAERNPEKFQ